MKKVLVTGAAGSVGLHLIKCLLAEGKYEITAIDLKNRKVFNVLKKYRKRINIIYADVLDRTLIEALVKTHDYVIHLVTCISALSEYKKNLANIIEYNTTENIVKAINYYNPKCRLIYVSSTSVYYKSSNAFVDYKVKAAEDDYFNTAKIKAEKLIAKKVSNYVILRMPLVIGDLKKDNFIYNLDAREILEVISKEDAAYAICRSVSKFGIINKKIINLGGGHSCCITTKELYDKILKYHGLSFKMFWSLLFLPKKYCSPVLKDSDKGNDILNYRSDSIDSIFMRISRQSKNRFFPKACGKLCSKFIKESK